MYDTILKNNPVTDKIGVPAVKADFERSFRRYTAEVHSFERGGVSIFLDCMKAESRDADRNILLVHGLTYSSREFDIDYEDYSLVRFLCDSGYAVWRLDISGYGQSGPVADGFAVNSRYASEDVLAAVREILSITKAAKIDLLGWSWGTVTSSLAISRCSGSIGRYVMYAPIMTGLGYAEVTSEYHENTREDAASDFQLNADGSINETITDSAVVDAYCSSCRRYDGESSPNGGRRDLFTDKSAVLIDSSKISVPTLIICGDNDPYLNLPFIRKSAGSLPEGSQLAVIGGAAHCMMLEKPFYHEFQQRIITFLNG